MLTRIHITNYRCLDDLTLPLAPCSLLLGYNGTGKSSVFDVLEAIRAVAAKGAIVGEAFPTDTISRFGSGLDQRFELIMATDAGELRYVLLIRHLRTGTVIGLEEVTLEGETLYVYSNGRVRLTVGTPSDGAGKIPWSGQRSFLATMESTVGHPQLTSFRDMLARIQVLRLNPTEIESESEREQDTLDPSGRDFSSWMRRQLQAAPDPVARGRDALRDVLPGFMGLRMVPAGRKSLLTAHFEWPGPDDAGSVRGREWSFDFHALSGGQKALIVLYTVARIAAASGALLCIDEPENFVAIREVQPLLVNLLDTTEELGGQCLVISHSSEVIDFLGNERAILLERPEGGLVRVGDLVEPGPLRLSELMARGWHVGNGNGHG